MRPCRRTAETGGGAKTIELMRGVLENFVEFGQKLLRKAWGGCADSGAW